MWEDVTVILACLGFTAALVVIVAELRGVIAQVEDAVHHDGHASSAQR